MARLIDAKDWDSFYADMGDSLNTMDSYDIGYMDALDRVDDWVDAQPTVDAVPVVRCKDCWKSGEGLCSYHLKNVPGKDFCGDGERRTDG